MNQKIRQIIRLLAGVLAFAAAKPACATWYNENIESGADIIMMDLRWPWWPSGTYFANWNSSFNPQPSNISFYAGFLGTVPDGPDYMPNPDEALQAAFRPGHVWSFWGSDDKGTPVRFIDVAPNLFIMNRYGGEGSSGTLGAQGWPFVKNKRWFTMLARVWRPLGESDHSYVGRWIKDNASGEWHLIAIAQLPVPAESFRGNSGFIEPLTNPYAVRSLHRRLGYFRKDGSWQKSDTVSIDKTQYVVVNTVPEEDHEYFAIEYAQRPDLLPMQLKGEPISGDIKHNFTMQQPPLPVLDKPAVRNVRAETNGKQLAVSWEIPAASSPAFAYKIEVFDNPEGKGDALAVKEARLPSARLALLDVATPSAFVRLTTTDIFDQTTEPVIIAATKCEPPVPAVASGETVHGLAYELFQKDTKRQVNYFYEPLHQPNEQHIWLHLDEVSEGKRVGQGLARGFDLSVREQRKSGYALNFSGHLRVPESGLYILRAQIDGAYRISISGKDVLTRDEQQGTTEKAVVCNLAKGDHPLHVAHLFDELPAANFRLDWEGPGFSRQEIPLDALRAGAKDAFPQPNITAQSNNDGTGKVSVRVNANGHQVKETVLFLDQLQLASGTGTELEFSGPFAKGINRLWCRVRYDENHTVTSDPVELSIEGKPVDPEWTLRNVGDAQASAGLWQTGKGAFQFFGSGMHIVTKKITGDFTATCRIDAYNGSNGEPVNRRAWVGLGAREHADRLNWSWGRNFHLVQTAADGVRSSADSDDLGGERISSYALAKEASYLRIIRDGDIWTAWTSGDGKVWKMGAYQHMKAPADLEVGLFFNALPQDALAHYHASVSELSVVPGIADDIAFERTQPYLNSQAKIIYTGLAISRSHPDTVVLRSPTKGLVRTEDSGKTWTQINGALTGEDLAVRSVAIHPDNPQIMLRASGKNLWKTSDAGKNWTRLDLAGDFDGIGPSALCGEVIDFDPKSPSTIFVGCESKGVFRSDDDGLSWTCIGATKERVTAVKVWPWEHYYPAVARGKRHLCVTTCADGMMGYLGRGELRNRTHARTSRSYISEDSGQTLRIADERHDTGFYNFIWDKASQSTGGIRYATTRGIEAQIDAGTHMVLYPEEKNLESGKPFTAIGASAQGDEKFGRVITQALAPADQSRLSVSERWAFQWSWQTITGASPQGGLIAVSGEHHLGNKWWFIYTGGIYFSNDGGKTLTNITIP